MPLYGLTQERQWEGASKTDWLTGAIQYSLHTATYTPDYDLHDFFNDATNEVTGTNYSANGVTLGSKTCTYDAGTDETRLDAGDAQWTNATISGIRYGIFWENTGGASTTDPLIGLHDLGAQSVTAATFTVQFDATGVWKIDTT